MKTDTRYYYLDVNKEKRNTAGAKAPADISELCRSRGYKRLGMPIFPKDRGRAYQKIWLLGVCTFHWLKIMLSIKSESVIIYQHPMYGNAVSEKMIPLIQKVKKARFVALIHDLESLRGGIEGVLETNKNTNKLADEVLLKYFDGIICHNEHMRQYMIGRGFDEKRLVNLEIFDYLSDCELSDTNDYESPSVTVAGNLAKGKSGYIYSLFDEEHKEQNANLKMHLYGVNYEESDSDTNIVYHGSFKPEELPKYLVGDYGLVWDGIAANTCAGNTGAYLRYNNPHKTSLYLSTGMPVIVWSEAAIADFVLENNVGIAVDSLYELEEKMAEITDEKYQTMRENAKKISKLLREGYYFYKALDTVLNSW